MFKIYHNDAFCFPGCMPEGYGPEDIGDTYDTLAEALDSAQAMLRETFEAEIKVNGDSAAVNVALRECTKELATIHETFCALPFRDFETDEINEDGYRYVGIAVVNEGEAS